MRSDFLHKLLHVPIRASLPYGKQKRDPMRPRFHYVFNLKILYPSFASRMTSSGVISYCLAITSGEMPNDNMKRMLAKRS